MHVDEIPGWFPPEAREELARLIEKHNIRTVLEIGTCYGLSAGWFAQRVERVTCIDQWHEIPCAGVPANVYDLFRANMAALDVAEKVTVIRGDSHSPDIVAVAPEVDLVYIDGDHTYEGCKADIAAYGPKARFVLCGDDYSTEPPEVAGVIRAVDEMVPDKQTHGRFWWVVK